MTLPLHLACLGGVAATIVAMAAQAHAEGNRLLPFWGQPYPYGYAWAAAEPLRPRIVPCRDQRRARISYGDARSRRCDVVLHARD